MGHTDSTHKAALSAVWFCHPRWEINWGGEFTVYDAVGDATEFDKTIDVLNDETNATDEAVASFAEKVARAPVHAVVPLPNRLVIFNSQIIHAARAPQKAGIVRLSTAFKFEDQPEADDANYDDNYDDDYDDDDDDDHSGEVEAATPDE